MSQIINAKFIRSFNPCKNGILNFEKNYPEFEGSLVDLLVLDNVPYFDKIWLVSKICDIKVLQMWSVLCAESVLPNFEKQFPNDKRVRECLEVIKKVISGDLDRSAARSAAWSAARSAARSAVWSAAWSAARSAESAAESAARSAVWSAWSAARSAESAARSAESEKEQEELNIKLLISLL